MADTQPPGGWPWGKNKQGSQAAGSTTEDKSVQEPELQQLQPEAESGGERTPIQRSVKDNDTQSQQSQSRASAMRGPASVGGKSVKYEDEQQDEDDKPVSVQGPGSNRSFSRTGKEPSEEGGAPEVQSEAADDVTETGAQSKKSGGEPEDEGKDLSEPADGESQQQSEKAPSQSGSRFTGFLSGAKNVGSFLGGGSSKKSQSQTGLGEGTESGAPDSGAPDSVRELQEKLGGSSQGGETLTVPEGGLPTSSEEDTPADTEDGQEDVTTTAHQTGTTTGTGTEYEDEDEDDTTHTGETEGLEGSEELRPEDSITHAADNSHLPTEGQTQTQTQTQARSTNAPTFEGETTYEPGATTQYTEPKTGEPTEAQTQYTEGQTAAPTEGQTQYTEGQTAAPTEGQTQYTEGQTAPTEAQTQYTEGQTAPTEAQTQYTEGQTQAGQSEIPTDQIPEGEQLPEGAQTQVGDQSQFPQGTKTEYESGYETATAPEIDYSILKGCKVNKLGNVVNDKGQAIGRIVTGIMSHLIGRKCDEQGKIWNDSGKEIGQAEPIPDNELQDLLDAKPFESFEGNVIDAKGWVKWQGETVGKIIEGDLKQLQGKTVDPDGEVLDKAGNNIGKAERYEEPEAEEEPEPEAIDMSILAGKRVNKAGNVVDSSGVIFGRVIDGDLKNMIGRMCNKNGEILSESGDVIGHAELVTEGEREGSKEGIFAELEGLTVAKDGTVVTPSGDIVGRLVSGDPKVLAGRSVDEDGDVLDSNGNVLGHAERWEPDEPEPEPEKEKGPLAGLHVNNDGNVVDKHGNIIAKLTSGDPHICAGKEIDDDGDVINSKGMTVGHVNLLSEIKEPEPEPEESEEEKAERLQKEQDKKLATQMAMCLEQCLDKIKPICKMITTKIEAAERKPEEERDEEALVKEVRPLIEEGGNILREAHGIIRGLDPDGHIQANAKHKSGTREASPEEFHLAEVIKELTGTVTETIDGAKRKLEDMPHAKKELSPLWGLLGEPLFQIIAAVGLLLTGVLGIVGRLLSGLGLGGIVDGLLGTLGLNRLLDGLGLGSLTSALTGKKKK